MFVVNHRKFFYWFSGIVVALSIILLFMWGLNLGIDFKGGSLLEVSFAQGRPSVEKVTNMLKPFNLGAFSVRPSGDNGYIIRMKNIEGTERTGILNALSENGTKSVEETRFDSIGPLLGKEATNKSIVSVILVLIAIVLFIAFAFRKVSEPVSSWKYGLIAIVALLHDVIVPTGVFVILGHFLNFEIDTLFITALLVILGFSIHDTIVVFDRVRENLRHKTSKQTFEHVVGQSISQTFTRSINTSVTVLLSLLVLYFLGSEATRHFVLALLVGITAGTYSSIFLGSPLLVTIEKWQNR